MEKTLIESGVIPALHRDEEERTGTCACIIHNKERTLCANIAASTKYPVEHLDKNMKYLKAAEFIYATAFFLTSNTHALHEISKFCAENKKIFIFNLGAGFLIETAFDDIMKCIEHSDYVFCNEHEADAFAKKLDLKGD